MIVDRDHNSMTFDLPTEEFAGDYEHVGMLKTIADSCGNTMRITASGCIVSNVQDGIGRNTVFANENNRVSTIYTPEMCIRDRLISARRVLCPSHKPPTG